MTATEFQNIYRELTEENPLAIRAVLKVLVTEFTDTVATLAVTCEPQPRLLVNLAFVGEHCRSDAEVKAVICHEFLHVLLRHTERFTALTPPEHLALDAVINAIIHRTLGRDYSRMMSHYYANVRGIDRLLRPPNDDDAVNVVRPLDLAWRGLYDGTLVADDIRDLARDLLQNRRWRRVQLLGTVESVAFIARCRAAWIQNTSTGTRSTALKWCTSAKSSRQIRASSSLRVLGGVTCCPTAAGSTALAPPWREGRTVPRS